MSTSTVPLIRRASAQMLSPSSISSTSPGTSRRAPISWRVPSRSTVARSGRNAASASTARSACISSANANPAFSTITTTIAMPSRGVPLTQARAAATASSTASGWVNWPASSRGQRRPPRRASSFGPDDDIRREVAGQVILHSFLTDPRLLAVTVRDGIVTMTGRPETAELGKLIIEAVRRLDGVVAVQDQLSYPE
jgi:hypothetical protein